MKNFEQWGGFEGRIWKEEINVRDFIQKNYTPYEGDESFLEGPMPFKRFSSSLLTVNVATMVPPFL